MVKSLNQRDIQATNLVDAIPHRSAILTEGNKELKSTKSRDGMHGYGTSIIAKIVEKYHGLVEYFEDDGMFGVQLVFPDKRQVVTDNAPL